MRRRRVALAVVMALAVMAAVPSNVSAASPQLDVGSQHTTDSDFQNAQTLTNLTVVGAGSSASVDLFRADSFDQFNGQTVDARNPFVGDNSSDAPYESEIRVEPTKDITVENLTLGINNTRGSDYGFVVDIYAVKEAPDKSYGEGTKIKDNWDPSFSTGDQTITLDKSVNMQAGETWTIEFVTQSTDNDGAVDRLTLNSSRAGTKTWYTYNGDTRDHIPDITLGGSGNSTPANYTSQVHNVTNPKEAAINITTANNVSINATVRTKSGTVLNNTQLSSAKNHTLSLSSTNSEKIVTELNVSSTGSNPDFSLADESILFDSSAPTVDNSSATPTGDVNDSSVTLSIDVNDSDFATKQSDELNVSFYVDGNHIGDDTLTQNGTATQSYTASTGGSHSWHVEVTDSYGGTETSKTFSFKVPNEMAIRNVSAPTELITGASVKLTFYSSDDVVTKNDSNNDGFINLTGLDPSKKFIVVVEADNYYKRTVVLDDVFVQDSVYLLNESKSAVEDRFVLDDPTGKFEGGDTEIFVKKALTRDFDNDSTNETRVVRIAGDVEGVEGFTVKLEEGARYTIEVRNADGDVRTLGEFTATNAETVRLEPVPLQLEFDNGSEYSYTGYQRNTTGQTELVFEYADPADETTNLNVRIWEQGNKSHQPANWTNVTVAGPIGDYQASPTLSPNETNTIWVVNFTADRSGQQITGEVLVGADIDQQLGGVAGWVLQAIAMVGLILTGALFSQANVGVGGVVTALVGGGFWYVGWLSSAAGGGVVLFLGVAVAYKFRGDLR